MGMKKRFIVKWYSTTEKEWKFAAHDGYKAAIGHSNEKMERHNPNNVSLSVELTTKTTVKLF